MKKIVVLTLCLYFSLAVCGQSQAVNTAGGSRQSGTLQLEYSIGELSIVTLQGGAVMLTQGVLQPFAAVSLPVKLISFSGKRSGDDVLLQWKTTNEINTSWFDIERSADGFSFTFTGKVKSTGDSSGIENKYGFTDLNAPAEKIFYRLKQIDKDGTFTYSNVISVQHSSMQEVRLYPNPAVQFISVKGLSAALPVKIVIVNMSGSIVAQKIITHPGKIELAIGHLAKGTYVLKVESKDIATTVRAVFVKQ